ncbi:unnamed protein product, partial [Ostreobium quekettii]
LPFDDRSLPRLFQKIAAADFDMPSHLSPELKDLLKRLMFPDPQKRIAIHEIRSHDWVDRDYTPVVPPELMSSPKAADAEDIFQENVELKRVVVGENSTDEPCSQGTTLHRSNSQYTAFHLIGTALDLSTLFENRREVIQRNTRFTCYGEPADVLNRISSSVCEVGGRVEPRNGDRIKIYFAISAQRTIAASAEVFDLLPGIQVVEIQRNRGDRRDFREFYTIITTALQDLMTSRDDDDAGSRSAPSCVSPQAV